MTTKEPPRRLGRGLAQLMGDVAAVTASPQSASVQLLPVADLAPSPFQPRRAMNEEALDELAASVKSRGVLQPLLVRPAPSPARGWQIIAGERRWRAAQRAGLHEVPVLIRDLEDADAMAAALVENLQRQDLDPIEEAEGFDRLIREFSLTQEELAQAVGKSRSHVTNMMRLLNLPQSVHQALRSGEITSGHARAILTHPDPETAARKIVADRLTVRQAEALTQAALTPREPKPSREAESRPTDPETRALERDLTERLGLKVKISFDGKGGTVAIAYRDLDQLDGLLTLLNR